MNTLTRIKLSVTAIILASAAMVASATMADAQETQPGGAISIGGGGQSSGNVWVIGTNALPPYGNGIWRLNQVGANNWTSMSGAATLIATSTDIGNPWVINAYHNIFEWNGSAFSQVSGAAQSIGVGPNNKAWVVGCPTSGSCDPNGFDNIVYQRIGSTFNPTTMSGVQVSVDGNGTPWVVNSVGQIWYSYQGTGPWTQLTGAPAAKGIAGGNALTWVGDSELLYPQLIIAKSDGSVYAHTGQNSWLLMGGPATSIAAAGGVLWWSKPGGKICYYDNSGGVGTC